MRRPSDPSPPRADSAPSSRSRFSALGFLALSAAPPLFDTLEICGKDRVRMRLRGLVAYMKTMDDWGGDAAAKGS